MQSNGKCVRMWDCHTGALLHAVSVRVENLSSLEGGEVWFTREKELYKTSLEVYP